MLPKVLIVTPTMDIVGGRERVLSNFSNYLGNQVDIRILTLSGSTRSRFPLPPAVEVDTIDTFFFSQPVENKKFYHNAGYFRDVLKLRRYLKKHKDRTTIISTDVYCSILLYFAGDSKGRKFIANEHMIFDVGINPGVIKLRNFIYPRLFDTVVTLTEQDGKKYSSVGCKNVVVIPNALTYDIPEMKPEGNNKTIIAIGRFSREKGFDMLIDACSAVFRKHPDWHLNLLGAGHLKEQLESQVAALHLDDNVKLLPPTDQVLTVLKEADIHVLSSRNEAYPMVLTEALSVGLACVSFDCPCGPREIIKDGEDGLLVPANDVNALANSINLLIEEEPLRRKLGGAAFHNIKRLRPDLIFTRWYQLIQQSYDSG